VEPASPIAPRHPPRTGIVHAVSTASTKVSGPPGRCPP
jgi:hypothetical protein